jgi:hypothetical protein
VYVLALVFCLPWLAFTHSVTGRLLVWGNSGSLSLYWMSSPYPQDLGDWRGGAYEVVVSDPKLVHHRDFFLQLAPLDPTEQNRRLEHRAIENIRGSPGKFAKNVAANVSRMALDFPFSETPETLSTLYYLIPNSLVLWALVASLALAAWGRVSFGFDGIVFAFFGVLAFALHSVLSAFPRMLMPLIPVALWFVFVTVGTAVAPYLSRTRHPRRVGRVDSQLRMTDPYGCTGPVPREDPVLKPAGLDPGKAVRKRDALDRRAVAGYVPPHEDVDLVRPLALASELAQAGSVVLERRDLPGRRQEHNLGLLRGQRLGDELPVVALALGRRLVVDHDSEGKENQRRRG